MADSRDIQPELVPTPESLGREVIISPDTLGGNRLPPRQSRTRKWPLLDAFGPPDIDLDEWQFEIGGLVESQLAFNWEEFQKLPRVKVFADMHCVTRWSGLGNLWEGVSTTEVMARVKVLPQPRYVLVNAYDGDWTTNLPLDDFLAEDALFADTHDGKPIPPEHGGPLRLVGPRLYAWKSAKQIKGIELMARDQPGFWERGGYHMRGDPWKEERFRQLRSPSSSGDAHDQKNDIGVSGALLKHTDHGRRSGEPAPQPRGWTFRATAGTAPSLLATALKTVSSVASRTTFSCSVKADSTPSGRLAAPSVSTRSIRGECSL